MKTLKLMTILMMVSMSLACAQKKSASDTASTSGTPTVTPPPSGTPYVPSGTGPGQGTGTNNVYGGTAPLTIQSLSVMGQYTGRPMNNPQNIRVTLNLVKTGSNTYGGTVKVSYTDNGYAYEGYFTSGTDEKSTKYNVAYSNGSQPVFHGFFEDFMGGLVVVIDQVTDLGDGAGSEDTVGGSIWFKNFGLTYAPHPPTYCWFVSKGPYDCRSWPSGDSVNTYASVYPNNGYVKLGTFTGMSANGAFNGQSPF